MRTKTKERSDMTSSSRLISERNRECGLEPDTLSVLKNDQASSEKNFLEYLYFRDIKHDLLSDEQVKKLYRKIKRGNGRARDEFVCHNLRLVVSVAKLYSRNGNFMDL